MGGKNENTVCEGIVFLVVVMLFMLVVASSSMAGETGKNFQGFVKESLGKAMDNNAKSRLVVIKDPYEGTIKQVNSDCFIFEAYEGLITVPYSSTIVFKVDKNGTLILLIN